MKNAVEKVICYNYVTFDKGLFQIPMVNLG